MLSRGICFLMDFLYVRYIIKIEVLVKIKKDLKLMVFMDN